MNFHLIGQSVQEFYRWGVFLVFAATVSVTLQCCGNELTRGADSRLQVVLKIPEGENPELFWMGTSERKLRWQDQNGNSAEEAWESGKKIEWKPREGDRITFEARDQAGRVVVDGGAFVPEEKVVTIPLRRVL